MRLRRRTRLLAALVLAAAAAAPLMGGAGGAPTFPQVVVKLDAVAPVDVDHDNDVWITTNGTVNITVPAFVTVETHVYFNVTVNNTFWPAIITPSTASLTGSGEVPFTVNVSVPGRAAADAGAQIYVDANVSVPPGIGKSFTGATAIPIIQYFGLVLAAKTSTSGDNFTAQAGTDTTFSLRLQNLGNGHDSFNLAVANIGDLQARGISVSLPSPISVPARVTVNVNGNVSVPASLTSGNFTLSFTALSTGAAAKGDAVTGQTEKRVEVAPPDSGGGGGGGGGGAGAGGKGFLPGFDLPAALGAAGFAALVACRSRRAIRP